VAKIATNGIVYIEKVLAINCKSLYGNMGQLRNKLLNSVFSMVVLDGSGAETPAARGHWWYEGEAPSGWEVFAIFSIKITHFNAYFGQNSYFKAITHQSKAFEKQFKHTN